MGLEYFMQGEWGLRDLCKRKGGNARDVGLHNEFEHEVRVVC
jgi:hypothetical protein